MIRWCPWVHDLALVASAAHHGALRIDCLRDPALGLPTAPEAVEALTRRTFLEGFRTTDLSGGTARFPAAAAAPAAASGVFSSQAAAEAWCRLESSRFPDQRRLEGRLEATCVALTACLPLGHPLRVRPCPISPLVEVGPEPRAPLALSALLEESAPRRSAYLKRRSRS